MVEKRIFTNLLYWRSNYLLFFSLVSLYSLYSSLWLCVAVLLIVAQWAYVFGVRRRPFVFGNRVLSAVETLGSMCLMSTMLLWLFGVLWRFTWMLNVGMAFVLLHAVLRPQNMKARYARSMYNVKQWRARALDSSSDSEPDISDADPEGGTFVTRRRPGTVETRQQRNEAYAQRRAQLNRSSAGGIGGR